MEDPDREAATNADMDGLEEDELELSLGLRPSAIRRQVHLPNPTNPTETKAVVEVSRDLSFTVPITERGGAGSEQALRRQEARRKSEEKRKLKAITAFNGNGNEVPWFDKQRAVARNGSEKESNGDFSERRRKGENFDCNGVKAATPVMARPVSGLNSSQFNGLPYLMMPGLVGFQPVVGGAASGFRPYHVGEKKSGHGGGGRDNLKWSVSSYSRGSSPGVSDYQSTCGQVGSTSDGASYSSHSDQLNLNIKKGSAMNNNTQKQTSHHSQPSAPKSPNGKAHCSSSSYHMEPSHTLENAPNVVVHNSNLQTQTCTQEARGGDSSKPPKPPAQQTNETFLLSQMPRVSTTGNGPDGKTITGLLYKYTGSEVSIVCVCHGTPFSPAGFVEHAGGVDIENPLRHIRVVPFTFS